MAVLPLVLLLARVVPHACQDYVIASCVEELIEEETLSRTITEQTAQRMIRAFKVGLSVFRLAGRDALLALHVCLSLVLSLTPSVSLSLCAPGTHLCEKAGSSAA